MKLEFKIDNRYLVHFASERYSSNPARFDSFLSLTPLKNRIANKYSDRPAYHFLKISNNEHVSWATMKLLTQAASTQKPLKDIFQKVGKDMDIIYAEIQQSKEFKELRKGTEQHLREIKGQWDKNSPLVLSFIKEIAGISLPRKSTTVLVTHPKLANGRVVPEYNTILWGHTEDWKNYHTSYLCHELMHILTKEKQQDQDIMHALIELMTDNELRIRLNEMGEYFIEEGKSVGHKDLRELELKIFPIWQEYLAGKLRAKNIFELEKYIIKKGIA